MKHWEKYSVLRTLAAACPPVERSKGLPSTVEARMEARMEATMKEHLPQEVFMALNGGHFSSGVWTEILSHVLWTF